MLAGQIAIILAITWMADRIHPGDFGPLYVTCMLGSIVFMAVGFIVGSLTKSPEIATGVTTPIQIVGLFATGLAIPLSLFPEKAVTILQHSPFGYLGDLFMRYLPGFSPTFSLLESGAVVGGLSLVGVLIAIRLFRWDSRD
jgi:ABC-2 type transport system permease protein